MNELILLVISLVYCLLGHNPYGQKIAVYNKGGLVNCEAIDADNYSVFVISYRHGQNMSKRTNFECDRFV